MHVLVTDSILRIVYRRESYVTLGLCNGRLPVCRLCGNSTVSKYKDIIYYTPCLKNTPYFCHLLHQYARNFKVIVETFTFKTQIINELSSQSV